MSETVTYTYSPWHFVEFRRESGHMHIWVSLFSSSSDFRRVPLIFDTGAYITVLTRMSARRIGLSMTGLYSANLTGFNRVRGSDKAEIVIAPKIEIGRFIVEDVQILVPLDDIEVAEVIGENVFECFSYTVDHDLDRVYFAKNPNPKPYKNTDSGTDLSCGRVLAQDN